MTEEWKPILDLLNPSGIAYGVIFGLAGFAVQLMVRGEWPKGRLNEGAPKTFDATSFGTALILAILIGIVAANWFTLKADVEVHLKDAAGKVTKLKRMEFVVSFENAIIVMAFGYVGADLQHILEKLVTLFKDIQAKLAGLLPKPRGSGGGK